MHAFVRAIVVLAICVAALLSSHTATPAAVLAAAPAEPESPRTTQPGEIVDRTTSELESGRSRTRVLATRAELEDFVQAAAALHAVSHAERTTVAALRAAVDFAEQRLRPRDAVAGRLVFRTDADLRRWQALQKRLDAAIELENTARANFLGLQHRAGTRVAER